jgi:hypothetical protein
MMWYVAMFLVGVSSVVGGAALQHTRVGFTSPTLGSSCSPCWGPFLLLQSAVLGLPLCRGGGVDCLVYR